MRKILLAIALVLVASAGTAERSNAGTPGASFVTLTLKNTSDVCVWVTMHQNTRELATKVLDPGHTWIVESFATGGVLKVRAQFWGYKNGCNGSFIQDRYDYIEGKVTLTISGSAYYGRDSYIMRR